jgi:hypothetical protein
VSTLKFPQQVRCSDECLPIPEFPVEAAWPVEAPPCMEASG